MRAVIIITVLVVLITRPVFSQQNDSSSYLSIGTRHAGLALGPAVNYSGLRMNVNDEGVRTVNGINLSIINTNPTEHVENISNGLAISPIVNSFTYSNGIAISGLADGIKFQNGISVGGFISAGEVRNGISAGFILYCKKANGLFCSVVSTSYDTLNGVSFSVCGHTRVYARHPNPALARGAVLAVVGSKVQRVDGVCAGLLNGARTINGLGIGAAMICYSKATGVIAGFYTNSTPTPMEEDLKQLSTEEKQAVATAELSATGLLFGGINLGAKVTGVQIGLFNEADELHGVQIGVLNHAKNSSLPWLPFINLVL